MLRAAAGGGGAPPPVHADFSAGRTERQGPEVDSAVEVGRPVAQERNLAWEELENIHRTAKPLSHSLSRRVTLARGTRAASRRGEGSRKVN